MKDLIPCKVARDDLQRWLASGNGPLTVSVGEKVGTLLIALEKTSSVDYLYRTSITEDGSISCDNSLLFCGVYDGENQSLYLAKDAQRLFTGGSIPLVTEAGSSVIKDICGKVNQRVENTIANDKSNLPVQTVTGWREAHDLQSYQEHGAKEDALRMLFGGHTPEGKFHSDYAMCEMPEAAFLSWLQDPDSFIQTEAETYIKSNPERFLLQFLKSEALLAEYQALAENTGSPIHRMKAITDAINISGAKMVNVTVQKDGEELTFKMDAGRMKGHQTHYSTYYIPAADRRRFEQVFGRNAGFRAEDVIRITYGRNTIYEAPSAQEERMAESAGSVMGGMI